MTREVYPTVHRTGPEIHTQKVGERVEFTVVAKHSDSAFDVLALVGASAGNEGKYAEGVHAGANWTVTIEKHYPKKREQ